MSTAWVEVWSAAMWRAAWQGGAAVLVVWGLCAVFGRGGPWVKCWLWRLGYLKFVAGMLVVAAIGVPVLPAGRVAPVGTEVRKPGSAVEAAVGGVGLKPTVGDAVPGNAGARVDEGSTTVAPAGIGTSVKGAVVASDAVGKSVPIVAVDSRGKSAWPVVGVGLFAVWILGVWLAGVQVICAWIRTAALRRGAVRVADGALLELVGRLGAELELRRVPELLVAAEVTGPLLTGVMRPAILLPTALAEEGNSEALRLALTHELAHVRRRDILWNVLHCAVEAVFFFHPLIWVGRRQARFWQELACDHLTLEASGATPAAYGQALLGIVAMQRGAVPALAGVGVADSVKTLRRRIMAMGTFRRSSSRRVVLAGALVGLAAVAGVLPWRLEAQSPAPVASVAPASAPATSAATSASPVERSGASTRAVPASAAVPAAGGGVVAHWSFDAVDGNGDYPDSVGNQHPATPADKAEVLVYKGDANAPFGGAVSLLGPTHPASFLTVPPFSNIQKTSLTIAAWVYLNSQNSAFVLADWPSMDQSAFAFGFHPFGQNKNTAQPTGIITSTEMLTGRGSNQRRTIISQKLPSQGVPLNEWHHVAWVWDRQAESLAFYFDGTSWGESKRNPAPLNSNYSTSLNIAFNNLPVRIGSQQLSVSGQQPANLTGAIDELWIFAEALTPIQIRNLKLHNDVGGKSPAPMPVMPVGAGGSAMVSPAPRSVRYRAILQVPVVGVQAAVDGRISEVVAKEGQRVKTGDVLFKMDDREAKAAVQLAEINLNNADMTNKERQNRAAVGGTTTEEAQQAANQVEVAKIQLQRARNALEDLIIRSPIDGTVQTFEVRPNQVVARGARVTSVAGDEWQVNIAVPMDSMRDLRVGRKFTVSTPEGLMGEGEIDYISTVGDAQSGTYMVRGRVLPGEGVEDLRSGMSVDVNVPVTK